MSRTRLGPTLALAVLAALLFAAFALLSPPEREPIRVTSELVEVLVANQEELYGRALTEEERQQAIDLYVEEEILVREAYRRGLDIGDRRVRPVLVDAGRRAIVDPALVDGTEPTPEEIVAHYESHREDYRSRETLDLAGVSFLVGTLAPEDEETVLRDLRAGVDPARVGGGLGQVQNLTAISRRDVSRSAGRDFAAAVFEADESDWAGPLRTNQAVFFVRVIGRTPGRQRELEEVEHIVRQQIVGEREMAALEEALEEVRPGYDVVIEEGAAR